jgi:hypothetical protein
MLDVDGSIQKAPATRADSEPADDHNAAKATALTR